MTSKIGSNSSSLKEAKKFWLKYRWEFMRRDPEYIRAYNDIMELEGKVQDKSDQNIDSIEATLDEKIKKYYRLFELSVPFFWDPNKTFEKVTKINYEAESPGLTQAIFYSTHDQKPVKIYTKYGSQDVPRDIILMEIDFTKVNSIDALKKSVIDQIDFYWKNDYLQRLPERIKVNKVNFDKIIEVGDLKKSNHKITWREIAAKTFPDDSDSESAIMKAKQHYSRYEELTHGGWRDLRFP
jgi:hypothetical protein